MLRAIGGTLLAVENKVSAQLQQPAAVIGLGFSQGGWGQGVHGMGQLRLGLSAVHRCVGPGVEYPVRLMLSNKATASILIRQIQLLAPAREQLDSLRAGSDQGLAQLTRRTGQKDLHWKPSPAAISVCQVGAAASLSANSGSVACGHAMAKSESLQSSERSLSRSQKSVVL